MSITKGLPKKRTSVEHRGMYIWQFFPNDLHKSHGQLEDRKRDSRPPDDSEDDQWEHVITVTVIWVKKFRLPKFKQSVDGAL